MRLRTLLGMIILLIITKLSTQAYSLIYKGDVGTVHTYKITMNSTYSTHGSANIGNVEMAIESSTTLVEKVVSVKQDGTMELSYESKDGKETMTTTGMANPNSTVISLPTLSTRSSEHLAALSPISCSTPPREKQAILC